MMTLQFLLGHDVDSEKYGKKMKFKSSESSFLPAVIKCSSLVGL